MYSLAFLFSGQGAQYPGMMRDLYESHPSAKAVFDTADRVLGRSISELCFDGTQEELDLTCNTQPCMLAAELAAYKAIIEYGVKPNSFAGFSLGEYTAVAAAGALDQEAVFHLVQLRAEAMQKAVPLGKGAMAAVMRLTTLEVKALCDDVEGYISPVNFNCPGQIVVSGEVEAVDRFLALAKERKIRAVKLPVSVPTHCKLMDPAAKELREAMSELYFNDTQLPVYMNYTAEPVTHADVIRSNLVEQVRSPVLWEQTLRNMYSHGIDTFVEIGPGNVLSKFVAKTLPDAVVCHVESMETLDETLKILKSK